MGLIVRNKKFYGNNPLQNLVDYSTDEQVIGTWIDGKPLYQKTFNQINPTKGSWFNLGGTGIVNGLNVVNIDGCLKATNGIVYRVPYYDGSNNVLINISNDNSIAVMIISSSLNFSELNVTIQYTKTTD